MIDLLIFFCYVRTPQKKEDYKLKYQTQNQLYDEALQEITNLDPQSVTLKELSDIIVEREDCSTDQSVELYTAKGIPLTNGSTYLDNSKYN